MKPCQSAFASQCARRNYMRESMIGSLFCVFVCMNIKHICRERTSNTETVDTDGYCNSVV